jgi:hypothetical protein
MGGSSDSIELEKLLLDYEKVLNEYNELILEYINYLNGATGKISAGECTAVGNSKYNSYCQASSSESSTCSSQCRTYVAGFGYMCCSSGCCGTSYHDYFLLGISDENKLVKRDTPTSEWVVVDDGDIRDDLIALCTGNDGKMVIGVTTGNSFYYKLEYDKEWLAPQNYCCILSVAMGQDGTLVGVGTDNLLWSKPDLNASWVAASSPDESGLITICIAPNGNIFALNDQYKILRKDSYKSLTTQTWTPLVTAYGVAMTVAPDGKFYVVGTDSQLWMQPDYKNLTQTWQPVNKDDNSQTCCVIGITTVHKPVLPIFTNIENYAFWGTSELDVKTGGTLEECNALCSTTSGCSGATYKPTEKQCFLRSGPGDTITSTGNYAIVLERDQLLKMIQKKKDRLDDLNDEIQSLMTLKYEENQEQIGLITEADEKLIQKYTYLLADREKTNNMVKYYQSLEDLEDEKEIFVTKNYYMYMLLLVITVIGIIILSKIFIDKTTIGNFNITPSTSTSNINPFYIIFGLILFFVFLNLYNQYFI